MPTAPVPAEVASGTESETPPVDPMLVEHRLVSLERLSQLLERGALTAQEFAAEKALVLRLPADDLPVREEPMPASRNPSLLGRLFGWRLVAAGIAAGLAFSAYTAPHELSGLLRFLG